MNALTPIEASEEPGVDIVALFEATPEDAARLVLQDRAKADAFYAACVAKVEAFTHDLSTQKGRDATRAFANKSTTTKTTIEKAKLGLTEDWRRQTSAVNAAGKDLAAKFADLAIVARKPLTDWEAAEADRKARVQAIFTQLETAPVVGMADTSETLTKRLEEIRALTFGEDFEAEHKESAERLQRTATDALTTAVARAKQAEQDARDLAAFRATQPVAAAPQPPHVAASTSSATLSQTFAPAAAVPTQAAPPPRSVSPDDSVTMFNAAKASLASVCGLDEAAAHRVAFAIARGDVAHVTFTMETRNAG